MGEYIKCVVKACGKMAYYVEITNNLETLQALVGGYIETVPVTKNIVAIVNEEGKLRGLAPNLYIKWDDQGRMIFLPDAEGAHDVLVGNVIFAGRKWHNFRSLSEKEADFLGESIARAVVIKGMRGM